MIELIFGLLIAGLAVALAFGFAPPELAIQGLQDTLSWVAGSIALLVIIHALFRLYRDSRDGATGWLRTFALMLVSLITAAVVLYAATAKISAASFSGWPVGYFIAGQGALVSLVLVFMMFRRKQNRIEDQHVIETGSKGQ